MPQLVSGVVVEQVGDDVLVVVSGTTEALCLSGEAAETVLTIQAGQGVSSFEPVVGDLVARGVVEVPGLSRRGLIRAGAVGAGAGIAVLALPSVAAASSVTNLVGSASFARFSSNDITSQFATDNFSALATDLYMSISVDYASLNVAEPALRAEGTVTSSQFSGSRRALYFSVGIWVALVAEDSSNPQAPGNGTFTLSYPGFRATGFLNDGTGP